MHSVGYMPLLRNAPYSDKILTMDDKQVLREKDRMCEDIRKIIAAFIARTKVAHLFVDVTIDNDVEGEKDVVKVTVEAQVI